MENASKALIIAGAILISILLISVGIMVMNSISGVKDEMTSQMDSTEVQQFNAQFVNYQGTKKSAAEVQALYSIVKSSNASHSTDLAVKMYSDSDAKTEYTSSTIASLSTTKTYTITIDYGSNGCVNEICAY